MINTLHLLILLALNTSNTTTVSWYGERFNGRQTASGEVYNMNNYTCASATLLEFQKEALQKHTYNSL